MIETLFLNLLLFLGVVWLLLGIASRCKSFIQFFRQRDSPVKEQQPSVERKVPEDSGSNVPHVLVARSKSFISSSFPQFPEISSNEKSADNPPIFASVNAETEHTDLDQKKDAEVSEESLSMEENEIQVSYTMDEEDEEEILREELQIADEAFPEVSPTILVRDLSLINGWHKDDSTLEGENELAVKETLQNFQGTQLMEYLKEVALKQEQDHQRLLAAIRKVEESLIQEPNYNDTHSASETFTKATSETTEDDKPLSYYL